MTASSAVIIIIIIIVVIIIIYPLTLWLHFFFFPSFFSALHCPLGLGELQACPFPDIFSHLFFLSALSSFPFHRALQDGFGQT